MTQPGEEAAKARSLGLALLDVSRIYEGFVIPSFEGRLWRQRRFPPHRRAIIALVGRQRRFLRAVYALADAGQVLEAVGPLRSMLEFLICQRWIAHDPDRNWKVWMAEDHAARDLWRERLRQHAPALHDAAVEALTPEQRKEGEAVAAGRMRVEAELGSRQPDDRRSLEQRAAQVGLSFLYDTLYRYESRAATHPTLFATDLLLEKHPKGLVLRGEPTAMPEAMPHQAGNSRGTSTIMARSSDVLATPEKKRPCRKTLGGVLALQGENGPKKPSDGGVSRTAQNVPRSFANAADSPVLIL